MAFTTIDPKGNLPNLSVEIDVTNAPTNASRSWTDITTYVRRIQYARAGRNDELQRTQPGTLQMTLNNRTGYFDPTNGSGVGIERTQWVRVRAQWAGVTYIRWQGIIETIKQQWPNGGKDAVAVVTAADASKVLNLFDLSGQTLTAKTSDQRVNDVAVLAGLTTTLADTGKSTIIATPSAFVDGSYASSHLQAVEQSENGLVFAGPDGTINFQSRHYRTLNKQTATDTIGDSTGEIPYRTDDASFDSDDAYIYNSIGVTPTNTDGSAGTTQEATDATSQTENFVRSAPDRTILVSDANEALSAAQYLISRYKQPSPRVPAVTVMGQRLPSKWPTILAAANSDRFTFKRRQTGHTISQDCYIEQISETIVPRERWDVKFQLSPADTALYWVLGVAGLSELGSTTILGY